MKYRALVFEDEKLLLEVFQHALEIRGYEVFGYTEPSKCRLISEDKFFCQGKDNCSYADFIITDHFMPGMTGIELVKYLKERKSNIKNIAIISGRLREEDIKIAEDLGCKVFIKPVELPVLFKWLDEGEKKISPERELIDF